MWLKKTLLSSIGSKMLMALTGLGLSLFVLVHMSGNLLTYAGQDAFNKYAHTMQSLGGLLWAARGGLLLMFVAHVYFGIRLKMQNVAARPVDYASKHTIQASVASRTMIWTGLLLLAFIIYHLMHFTLHAVHFTEVLLDSQGRPDVYTIFVGSFKQPAIAGTYILAMLVLGAHLSHGFSSLFQSLGWNHPKYNCLLKALGPGFAILIMLGNISLPIAVLCGVIK